MQDELVQMTSLVAETGLAVAALLGGAEFVLEERIVLGADDGEVIRHVSFSFSPSSAFGHRCLLSLRVGSLYFPLHR